MIIITVKYIKLLDLDTHTGKWQFFLSSIVVYLIFQIFLLHSQYWRFTQFIRFLLLNHNIEWRWLFPLKSYESCKLTWLIPFKSLVISTILVGLSQCTRIMIWWLKQFPVVESLKNVLMCFIVKNCCRHNLKQFC